MFKRAYSKLKEYGVLLPLYTWPHQKFKTFCMLFFSFFFFFGLFAFSGAASCSIWKFLGQGSNQSYSRWPVTEPQQRGIWAASATYTTALGNAGSLTHWARPWTVPATSWFLVRFVNHWATKRIPLLGFCLCLRHLWILFLYKSEVFILCLLNV